MAGLVITNKAIGGHLAFDLDHPGTIQQIKPLTTGILTLQADGEELAAMLWGLEQYRNRVQPRPASEQLQYQICPECGSSECIDQGQYTYHCSLCGVRWGIGKESK